MVTYEGLFTFCLVLIGVAELIFQFHDNKNPPAEPGVFHMTGIALCCWPRVTSRRYDLTPAWSLLLATRKRVV